jgi:glycine/D-amino acid oxidase-like deaminating enzyme
VKAALDEAGETYEEIDPAALGGYRPGGPAAREAIHIPREGRVDPRRLFTLFERSFAGREAVSHIDAEATHIAIGPGGLKFAELAGGGRLAAPKLLIAAGAYSGALIAGVPELGGRVPEILYGTGIGLLFERAGSAPAPVLRIDHPGFDHGIHLVPQDGRVIYVGSTSDVAAEPDPAPRADRVAALKAAAASCFDAALSRLSPRVLLGHRPVAADGFPLIGETSVPGLFVLSGTRRDGLHLCPVYARDMAARILEGRGLIAGFEPERPFTRPA